MPGGPAAEGAPALGPRAGQPVGHGNRGPIGAMAGGPRPVQGSRLSEPKTLAHVKLALVMIVICRLRDMNHVNQLTFINWFNPLATQKT